MSRRLLLLVTTALLAPLLVAVPTTAATTPTRPAVVETRLIGTSVQGRPIVAWRLGQPTATRKVVVFSAMHGNEFAPSKLLYDLRDGRPVRGVDLWVVPMYNPDGIARHTRQNAHRVDLNRNYPRSWKRLGGSYYSGPSAASEPETRAMMRFLAEVRPAYVVSFHQPLYGVGRTSAKGAALVQRLHRQLRLPVRAFNCDGVCHGTMTDWFNASFPGVAVTVEYGHGLSARRARSGAAGLLRAVGGTR